MEFFIFVVAISLVLFLKSSGFKGLAGEVLVNLSSSIALDKNVYKTIHNITLPMDGGTTQIDHIVLSPFGVFVIETKNMSGWIYGSERSSLRRLT